MRGLILTLVLASVVTHALAPAAEAAGTFGVVVRPGQSAGAGNGNFFAHDDPILNDSGRVAFTGFTDSAPFFLAVQGPEAAHIVLRMGLQAPDMAAGVTFAQVGSNFSLRQSNDNQLAFTGNITGPGINSANDIGVWAGDPNNLKLVTQTNDLAPGASGLRLTGIDNNIAFGNGGFVSFMGTLENNKTGLWAGTDNNVQLVAMEGGAAAGLSGYTFNHFFGNGVHLTANNLQRVAFQATASSPTASVGGIWSGAPGSMQLIAYEGMPVLGGGNQIQFLHRLPQINDSNEVAFWASVGTTFGIPSDLILLKKASSIVAIYQPGATPPGYAAGSSFGTNVDFQFANNRQMVFFNHVRLPNSSVQDALFASDDGTLRLVAREGQQIPNAPGNLLFDNFWQYYVNSQGRAAFLADVSGDATQRGIWAENAARQLTEIVRTGTQIQLAPGDVRTLTDVDWPGAIAGNFSPLSPYNSNGQIVFKASFGTYSALMLYTPNTLGDYNGNGIVDAADYVIWRKTLNSTGSVLAADGNGDNQVNASDYQYWRAHFGQIAASGAGGTFQVLTIPEPGFAILSFWLLAVWTAIGPRHGREN